VARGGQGPAAWREDETDRRPGNGHEELGAADGGSSPISATPPNKKRVMPQIGIHAALPTRVAEGLSCKNRAAKNTVGGRFAGGPQLSAAGSTGHV
jgi:hypothetical protein